MVLFSNFFYFVSAGVVPEYQCAVKRKEKKAQKDKDKPVSTTNGSPESIKVEEPHRVSKFFKKYCNSKTTVSNFLSIYQKYLKESLPNEIKRNFVLSVYFGMAKLHSLYI